MTLGATIEEAVSSVVRPAACGCTPPTPPFTCQEVVGLRLQAGLPRRLPDNWMTLAENPVRLKVEKDPQSLARMVFHTLRRRG